MNKITNIARTGICDFICKYCDLNNACSEYNHKDNDVLLDQSSIRMEMAIEEMVRRRIG